MTPKELVKEWVERFNRGEAAGLAALYALDAVNDQVVFSSPLRGREAIRKMFELEFSRATMVCIEERIYECGDTAILQWKDPKGLRGCSSDDEKIQQVANVETFRDLHAEESAPLLKQLQQVARERKNTFEALVNAARVCSLGSVSHALYDVGGEYLRNM